MSFTNIKLKGKIVRDLKKVNWTSDRKILIDDWKKILSGFGLHGHKLADEVLMSFGGLKIDSLIFNPTIETSLMFEELKEINQESSFNFFPIAVKEDIMIVIEENGKIFGMMSDIILRYGNNFEESLNKLLEGHGDIECLDWDYKKW